MSAPSEIKRLTKFPLKSNTSTKPCPGARNVIAPHCILQGIGNIEVATQFLNIKGSITGGQIGVSKRPDNTCRTETAIEDIDRSRVKIGGIKEITGTIVADSQAFVNGAGG